MRLRDQKKRDKENERNIKALDLLLEQGAKELGGNFGGHPDLIRNLIEAYEEPQQNVST
jgi:hypothetical protein